MLHINIVCVGKVKEKFLEKPLMNIQKDLKNIVF